MAGNEQDDIEQIMNEIEELQKEITPDTPATAAVSAKSTMADVEEDILQEIQAQAHASGEASADAGLEDTLAELKEEASSGGLLDEVEKFEDEVEKFKDEVEKTEEATMSQSNDGTLSLNVTGNMTLKLKYEFEGQEVTISFVDHALKVQTTDGAEFKIPFSRGNSSPSNVKPFKKAV